MVDSEEHKGGKTSPLEAKEDNGRAPNQDTPSFSENVDIIINIVKDNIVIIITIAIIIMVKVSVAISGVAAVVVASGQAAHVSSSITRVIVIIVIVVIVVIVIIIITVIIIIIVIVTIFIFFVIIANITVAIILCGYHKGKPCRNMLPSNPYFHNNYNSHCIHNSHSSRVLTSDQDQRGR